ncbi:hypothetical protein EHQ58_10320 [Leptospira ognonensis]|uniref:Uncharacterized protein n=1 Tax=Leptospira ognonensis TaxID=2484945 RepID=A0A4R9K2Z2_9LEPT|nr:hypothetical protein [Leptospira ognonensis]TGL58527.1 hypothetical protein EHQ58_10320 [Leptospira ognonensis]
MLLNIRIIVALLGTVLLTQQLSAKCYSFRESDIKVCINGDTNEVRKKASAVCKKTIGKDCGPTTGASASCNGTKCYDESGSKRFIIKAN